MSKKTFILLFIVCILVGSIAGFVVWRNNQQKVVTKTPAQVRQVPQTAPRQIPWQGVNPGMTYENVAQLKGTPKRFDVTGNTGTIYYPGANQYWDTEVSIQGDAVSFIREHIFLPQNVSLKSRLSSVGGTPIKLYGQISISGQYVYVFPKNGIAFLANEKGDTVYEVWYFPPGPTATVLALPQFSNYSTDPNSVGGF